MDVQNLFLAHRQVWAFFASPKFQYTLSLSGGFNGFILLYARFCAGKDAHF